MDSSRFFVGIIYHDSSACIKGWRDKIIRRCNGVLFDDGLFFFLGSYFWLIGCSIERSDKYKWDFLMEWIITLVTKKEGYEDLKAHCFAYLSTINYSHFYLYHFIFIWKAILIGPVVSTVNQYNVINQNNRTKLMWKFVDK